jgi:hypothetical protein
MLVLVIILSVESCSNLCRKHRSVSCSCAIGKPHSEELTTLEKEAFNQCGVVVPTRVLVYNELAVKTNRTVSARTRQQTLRDNSGFVYSHSGRNQYALLKKVVVCDGREYAVALTLSHATRQLCSDEVTNAKLNSHLTTLNPPL